MGNLTDLHGVLQRTSYVDLSDDIVKHLGSPFAR
jgi:hypothetical protein